MNEDLGTLIRTADGSLTLRHPEHGEDYHSQLGAKTEACDLYIAASGFEERLQQSHSAIAVLDVGLGLGYNALATLESWNAAENPPYLSLLSLEINPDLVEALACGEAPWMSEWPVVWRTFCSSLVKVNDTHWIATFEHSVSQARALWDIRIGDATSFEKSATTFDFVWQDAFSPKHNPELWTKEWFAKVFRLARPGAVLMTYSVAATVRGALTEAGWDWEKIATPGPKKEWLKGVKPSVPAKELNG